MKKLLYFFPIALLFSQCITEIDLTSDTRGLERLVVDGDFTDQNGAHQLRLFHPNRYGVSSFTAIEDATVKILDDLGHTALYEPTIVITDMPFNRDFHYELPAGAMPIGQGRSYHIEIELADGRRYASEPQQIPGHVPIDSLVIYGKKILETGSSGALYEQRKAFVEAAATVPANNQNYWLRYEAQSVGFFEELPPTGPFEPQRECYLTDNFNNQKIVTQEVKNGSGKAIRVLIGAKDVDFHMERSIYFTVIQHSLNKPAFDFWQAATKVANPQGSVFDPPPGAIKSNLRCTSNPEEIPLGYFEVAAVDTIRKRLYNGDLGDDYFVNPSCFYKNFVEPSSIECKNCILYKNSSYKKPHYWVD